MDYLIMCVFFGFMNVNWQKNS